MILQLLAPPLPSFISAGEDTYEAGRQHPDRRDIDVFDLLVVTKGALQISEEGENFRVNAGETLILYPKGHHYPTSPCDSTTHFYWFHFTANNKWISLSPELTNQEYKEKLHDDDPFKEKDFSIRISKHCKIMNWEKLVFLCKGIIEKKDLEASWELRQQLLFQQLLQELSNNSFIDKSLPSVALAEKAAAYLRGNYTVKLSYNDLGEALKFHPNHIARCMIEVLGYGPIEYVNRYRIEQAKSLLIYTDWSIERIAESCGFFQAAYFSRLFKERVGITPNKFRKNHKEP